MTSEMRCCKLYVGGRKGNVDGMGMDNGSYKKVFPFAKRGLHVESKSFLFNFPWNLRTYIKK
jgi:hypothetical protein